jgi:hypothetical protein
MPLPIKVRRVQVFAIPPGYCSSPATPPKEKGQRQPAGIEPLIGASQFSHSFQGCI